MDRNCRIFTTVGWSQLCKEIGEIFRNTKNLINLAQVDCNRHFNDMLYETYMRKRWSSMTYNSSNYYFWHWFSNKSQSSLGPSSDPTMTLAPLVKTIHYDTSREDSYYTVKIPDLPNARSIKWTTGPLEKYSEEMLQFIADTFFHTYRWRLFYFLSSLTRCRMPKLEHVTLAHRLWRYLWVRNLDNVKIVTWVPKNNYKNYAQFL